MVPPLFITTNSKNRFNVSLCFFSKCTTLHHCYYIQLKTLLVWAVTLLKIALQRQKRWRLLYPGAFALLSVKNQLQPLSTRVKTHLIHLCHILPLWLRIGISQSRSWQMFDSHTHPHTHTFYPNTTSEHAAKALHVAEMQVWESVWVIVMWKKC